MSNVIVFRREIKGRPAMRRSADLGRILLFTGVRYIRDDEDSGPATPAAKPAAKRSRPRHGATSERLLA